MTQKKLTGMSIIPSHKIDTMGTEPVEIQLNDDVAGMTVPPLETGEREISADFDV